jgi:hypothetical protein
MVAFNASTPPRTKSPRQNGILAHAKSLCDARARPTRKRQQDRSRPIRLATIARTRQHLQSLPLLLSRAHR